jgi:hypothetical protein
MADFIERVVIPALLQRLIRDDGCPQRDAECV